MHAGLVRWLLLLVCCVGGAAQAQASVPWSPSAAGRHAIELLVDEAGLNLPTTQWPLPRAAVSRALDALPAQLPDALDAARKRVKDELRAHTGSGLSLTIRGRADGLPGFGDDSTPGSSIALRSSTLVSPYAALQVGGRIETLANANRSGVQFRLDDSAIVTEAFGVQLQAWSHRSWWSPGWQSALALSNNAPAFSGLGLQRASASTSESPWLAWLGPWNFDVFIAQTEDVSQPAHPFLIGNRFTLRPFSNLEIGLTRTMQWGGRDRSNSPRSLVNALTGKGTNADTAAQRSLDPANELGGIDLRLCCPTGLRCAAYGQLIGEDEAGHLPSKYLGLYGLEFWSADGSTRYFAELAETGCRSPIGRPPELGCAYRNFAYPQGYVRAGRWIGASVGPDSRLLTLGLIDAESDTSVKLQYGRVGSRVGTYSALVDDPQASGRLIGIAARRGFRLSTTSVVTPEFEWQRVSAPGGVRTEARVGASLRLELDGAFDSASNRLGSALSSTNGTPLTQALVGIGLIGGAAALDRRFDDYAQRHGDNPSAKTLRRVGDVLPLAGISLAGLSWLAQRDSTQGDVGFTAVTAGITAVAAAQVIKLAVDRARPTANLGAGNFGDTNRGRSAFPSGHATLAWAVLTPYAEHYDAPWLNGVAALSNASRVIGRKHWFSDTVGGALLGYWIGDRFYRQSSAAADRSPGPRLWLTPRSVVWQVPFD